MAFNSADGKKTTRYNVMLDEDTVTLARDIGDDSLSVGLRKLAEAYRSPTVDLQSTAKEKKGHTGGWQEDGTYRVRGRVIQPPMSAEEFVEWYIQDNDLPPVGRLGRNAKIERDHYPLYLQSYYHKNKIPEHDWL